MVLGGKNEAPALRRFLALNRAIAEIGDLSEAAVLAAEALLKHGSDDDRAYVRFVAEDAMSAASLRTRLLPKLEP